MFLDTNNKLEKEIKKTIPFMIAWKKYIEIKQTNKVAHTYKPRIWEGEAGGSWVQNQPRRSGKTLSQNKRKQTGNTAEKIKNGDISCLQIGKSDTVKISILPKVIQSFNTLPNKNCNGILLKQKNNSEIWMEFQGILSFK